ncbi:hypothetical protein OG474_30940 [Kribbella sp. NBC_01505]|uniref:hypothetical protein n=1 Tax=Kribbella sp. NBC_01505 TaxID=2903580 RepID=UPI00386F09D9
MGIAGGTPKGRSGPSTPAVVGVGRSMRARDVSRPREPFKRRGAQPPENRPPAAPANDQTGDQTGGSSPVDS